jgi:hypothetical protein
MRARELTLENAPVAPQYSKGKCIIQWIIGKAKSVMSVRKIQRQQTKFTIRKVMV